jgi:hypothetical protein
MRSRNFMETLNFIVKGYKKAEKLLIYWVIELQSTKRSKCINRQY